VLTWRTGCMLRKRRLLFRIASYSRRLMILSLNAWGPGFKSSKLSGSSSFFSCSIPPSWWWKRRELLCESARSVIRHYLWTYWGRRDKDRLLTRHKYGDQFIVFRTAHYSFKYTNKIQRYTNVFITVNALHVSGGFIAHHQELKTVHAATASGSSKQAWHIPDAVCTVLSSWWWAEKPPETCRAAFLKLWSADHKWSSGSALVVLLDWTLVQKRQKK